MQIYQPKDGYCYNSDTLFLYSFAKDFLKPHSTVLEVGAGCGILGLLCARDIPLHLTLIEKNPKIVEFCTHNLRINHSQADLICDDFLSFNFQAHTNHTPFDVILSNPPFYHDGVVKSKNSDISSARYAENLPFFDFVKKSNAILKHNGELIFCYDAKSINTLTSALNAFKIPLISLRFVYPKPDKSASLVLCRAKKNSKSLCVIFPPLFTHESGRNGDFTQETKSIYKSANTWSIKC